MKLSTEDFLSAQTVMMFDKMQFMEKYEYCDGLKQVFINNKKFKL